MYWTWGGKDDKGKDDKNTARNNWMQGPIQVNGMR
jgi:hypothetical protein